MPKKRFEKMYFDWLENIQDWNISRQIVWGPRIPAWYCLDCQPEITIDFIDKKGKRISGKYQDLKSKHEFAEIKKGLQNLTAPKAATYSLDKNPCKNCKGRKILQETDTFDTWFLSGQWPLTTLGYPDGKEFRYFYPTSVLDTLWDILFFWVARMMIFGLYLAKDVPFKVIHLHARVVDKYGQKMSKSKGNVINPLEMIDKYGADALRMALIVGVSPGSDIALSDEKVQAMRNFANKIWNAARFVLAAGDTSEVKPGFNQENTSEVKHRDDRWILEETNELVKQVTMLINRYRFDLAADKIYHFFWHKFCDKYIEMTKKRREEAQPVLLHVLETSLKLLHPFMPFIAEQVWQVARAKNKKRKNKYFKEKALIVAKWPELYPLLKIQENLVKP